MGGARECVCVCVCVCADCVRCVCVYVCMHACMHVCMYVCMYVCVYVYMCVCMCVRACVPVCMCVYRYVYEVRRLMGGARVCVCVCVCVRIVFGVPPAPPIKQKSITPSTILFSIVDTHQLGSGSALGPVRVRVGVRLLHYGQGTRDPTDNPSNYAHAKPRCVNPRQTHKPPI